MVSEVFEAVLELLHPHFRGRHVVLEGVDWFGEGLHSKVVKVRQRLVMNVVMFGEGS